MCNEVSDVFIDGTFKYCAKFYLQMKNMHGLGNGQNVPLEFIWLP